MMQLIHDLTPGARLAFHTAFHGGANFASSILQLAAAGCDLIVDDIRYYTEPMFQDGIVAQAVDQVASQGIPYFASAGNYARRSWEAPSGFNPISINSFTFHQFGTNSDGSPIVSMRIRMQGNSIRRIFSFQWDHPFFSASGAPGSKSD
jgi:hypothetical protein